MRVAVRLSRARNFRRGAAVVELAVLLSLLGLITVGCVDFGRFAYSYIAVTNAARAGAAYGIMNNYTSFTLGAWKAGIVKAARAEMPQLTDGNLTVPTPSTGNGLVEANGLRRVHVAASYQFQTLIPWPGLPTNPTISRAVELRQIR
jgi:Flp pilus assembly protein TadG